jgi:hypothetical protein
VAIQQRWAGLVALVPLISNFQPQSFLISNMQSHLEVTITLVTMPCVLRWTLVGILPPLSLLGFPGRD